MQCSKQPSISTFSAVEAHCGRATTITTSVLEAMDQADHLQVAHLLEEINGSVALRQEVDLVGDDKSHIQLIFKHIA